MNQTLTQIQEEFDEINKEMLWVSDEEVDSVKHFITQSNLRVLEKARRECLEELYRWLVNREGYAVKEDWSEEEFAILDDVAKYVSTLIEQK